MRQASMRPIGVGEIRMDSFTVATIRMLAVFCLAVLLLHGNGAQAQGAFYQASPQEIAGPPGTIMRKEPMPPTLSGGAAYRVLYRSTGLHSEPIAVSGVVIVPPGPVAAAGRPIVAWAHPTTGVVPRCAPALALFIFQQIQGLRQMTERGYIVVATDYPGLGTPQTHPYLVGVSEARAVLDSVRAARSMGGAQNRFAVWGHSQGGQAALFTGTIASSYAPELDLVGVAAAAPATDLATLLGDDIGTGGGRNLTAMTLWSWSRLFGAPIDRVVYPAAIPIVDRLAGECIESVYDLMLRRRTARPLEQKFLSVTNFYTTEPWRALMAANSPGTLPPQVPLFLAQGGADELVRPQVTRDYMKRQCAVGGKVRMLVLPNSNHGFIGRDAAAAAVDWMADRFAAVAAPSDCGRD
jgi:acetyl esterase/lipase